MNAWVLSGEMSEERWRPDPLAGAMLIPAGFGLLLAQCASELVKRVAFLTGHRASPFSVEPGAKSDEERLAEELAAPGHAKKLRGGPLT